MLSSIWRSIWLNSERSFDTLAVLGSGFVYGSVSTRFKHRSLIHVIASVKHIFFLDLMLNWQVWCFQWGTEPLRFELNVSILFKMAGSIRFFHCSIVTKNQNNAMTWKGSYHLLFKRVILNVYLKRILLILFTLKGSCQMYTLKASNKIISGFKRANVWFKAMLNLTAFVWFFYRYKITRCIWFKKGKWLTQSKH